MRVYKNTLPEAQGLYSPDNEHDACGIGFVVDIKGRKSHSIVRQGLTILANLAHRGGAGSEENTGDGAGILLQIPDRFFRKALGPIVLPASGQYAVGMVFMPMIPENREACRNLIEKNTRAAGLETICWRDVSVNETILGAKARDCRPHFAQIFVKMATAASDSVPKSSASKDSSASISEASETDLIRRLYRARKLCERQTEDFEKRFEESFYFASFSNRTVVYKGMLTAEQMDAFYMDLADLDFESGIALVHSRYSTNTFPSWERAHPYRFLIHNGEINTLRGNVNSMRARESHIRTEIFGRKVDDIFPIINPDGSDSAMFDNALEFLLLSGRSLEHAALMMVPEPWYYHEEMSDARKAFYEYHSMIMEPWDGPAAMAFTDGRKVCAILDRNGLRPSRYTVTKDGRVILSSETGVLDIPNDQIVQRERLRPGRVLLIDTEKGVIIEDEEIKDRLSSAQPYREWLNAHTVSLEDLPCDACAESKKSMFFRPFNLRPEVELEKAPLQQLQKAFGYSYEDLRMTLVPMAREVLDPLGAMGVDTPIAVLSEQPQLLYNYFKQLFAQVTNPPIDALREKIVVMSRLALGAEGDLMNSKPTDCRKIILDHPILKKRDMDAIKSLVCDFKSATLSILYPAGGDGEVLQTHLDRLCLAAERALNAGANVIILSDVGVSEKKAAIPALLAVSALHQHMTRERRRKDFSLVIESGEPREVHHFCMLVAFGASAIYPYLAYESIKHETETGFLDMSYDKAEANYIHAAVKGMIKVLSKMGISTIQSYKGSQIFEAIGLGQKVMDKYFTSTPSRVGGIGLKEIARETNTRHERAFAVNNPDPELDVGGQFQWRNDGEVHMYNPMTVQMLQRAVRSGNYELYKAYSREMNDDTQKACTIRGLLRFAPSRRSIAIEEVEPVETIVRRFKTGAMSYGSISKEAHEALAIAMNRLGGKSNTGEGGEDPERFTVMPNGDSANSAIKQIASGRFGVTSHYLVNARELQIKMAQGAKPGEGGQLPGRKVYPWIAKTRHSTPGVGLISPPPHHDIYSIEDLAELIFDLKNANKYARVSVKLVSEVGVGTVAAGVAKGRADVVLISGYDGGTGASPRTSIRHAGLPWELGLAETHQTLILNDLRSRIVVETDGKLMTGRDVAVAALLGAEEFGFATAPLVALGCVMMRVCNLDTCPVGVATQNPALRSKFAGKPEHVVNFMRFVAQELREIMAELGVRTINEMVGRTDLLVADRAVDFWKTRQIDLSSLLYRPGCGPVESKYCTDKQDHKLEQTMDHRILIPLCEKAIAEGKAVEASLPIRNVNRVVGTQLGSMITSRYGAKGLPEDTIRLTFTGSAGQSFGAFTPKGLTMTLMGDANDYLGKGLSGGKIIVRDRGDADYDVSSNISVGNTVLYGATSGEVYIRGVAGERFAVRNSGATAVVEGCGDHGCEYMTGGKVLVLGPTGRNFAAGMSGGVAYVLRRKGLFEKRCNTEMVSLYPLTDENEIEEVRDLLEKHVHYTDSTFAAEILENFETYLPDFVKIMPKDYERMLQAVKDVEAKGLTGDEALMAAFEANYKDVARVTGS